MSRESTVDNLENIANSVEQRKPVFVDEQGQLHDAEILDKTALAGDDKALTQIKPTTWYWSQVCSIQAE
jgi:hypothetical protein